MWARCAMQNSVINSHHETNRLSSLMCAIAHCSLTCIENPINAILNNSRGRCEIVCWLVIMQRTCAIAHCLLTCTENFINVVLNNPCGLHTRCGIVRSTSWCDEQTAVSNVRSYTLFTHICMFIALMWFSIIRVDSVCDAEQCDQQSWCSGRIVVCNVRSCALFTHVHRELH